MFAKSPIRSLLLLHLAVLLAAGCATTSPPAPAPPATAARTAADPLLVARGYDATLWVRTAAEQRALSLLLYRLAEQRITTLAEGRAPGSWAVVTDADETIFDNSLFQKEITDGGQLYDEELWLDWCERREAGAIPGAVAFLRRVKELGGVVAVVTNRPPESREDTEANLRTLGVSFDVALLPEEGDRSKGPRFEKVRTGTAAPHLPPLEILMFVGDDIRDFPGGSQALATAGEEAFELFGDRWIVLPNPIYGSFKRNPWR